MDGGPEVQADFFGKDRPDMTPRVSLDWPPPPAPAPENAPSRGASASPQERPQLRHTQHQKQQQRQQGTPPHNDRHHRQRHRPALWPLPSSLAAWLPAIEGQQPPQPHGPPVVVVDALLQRLLRAGQWFAQDASLYISYAFVRRYAPDDDNDAGPSSSLPKFAIKNRRSFPTHPDVSVLTATMLLNDVRHTTNGMNE